MSVSYRYGEPEVLKFRDGKLGAYAMQFDDSRLSQANIIIPLETVAGMDVGEVYRLYGDRIFLTGGIDMSQLLSIGAPDEVRAVCRQTIQAAPTGYFMGSTTEIDNSSRLENVLAMIEVSWGYYPHGARPDIMEQIRRRKEQALRKQQE